MDLPVSARALLFSAMKALRQLEPPPQILAVGLDPTLGQAALFPADPDPPGHAYLFSMERPGQLASGPVPREIQPPLPLADLAPIWSRPDPGATTPPQAPTCRPVLRLCLKQCPGCGIQRLEQSQPRHHPTAIRRGKLSRPLRIALQAGLIQPDQTLLDYGSGRGEDGRILEALGFHVQSWDPITAPEPEPAPADVVNLGFVLNVLPDPESRWETLRFTHALAHKRLIVAAHMHNGRATLHRDFVPYRDGVLTRRGSFQKLYYHAELRAEIEQALGRRAEALGFGVFTIGKNAEDS